ncbi:MAG: hypothetical protein AB7J35_12310 [Dehalococcoidia bacterium]
MTEELQPGGQCWCGCGSGTKPGAFFLPGHDRAAEAAVVTLLYGGIPQFLKAHGFGPDARSAIKELSALRRSELR